MKNYGFHAAPGSSPGNGSELQPDPDGISRGGPDGLSGGMQLQNVQSLAQDGCIETLERLDALIGWAQAQQARTVTRLEALVSREMDLDSACDSQTAFRLVASEIGALLCLPPMTAQRLVGESMLLCSSCPETLAAVEAGKLNYRKAQIICSTVVSLREPDRGMLEAQLLAQAGGLTANQLDRLARRMYENLVPDSELTARHRRAKDRRRVWLESDLDGMCFLNACLPAQDGQAIFAGLTTCARAEQAAGDPRNTDQLRADILTSLLVGRDNSSQQSASPADGRNRDVPAPGDDVPGGGIDPRTARPARGSRRRGRSAARPIKAEVMVLINAETLLGLDDRSAELHGYGPISAEAARELLRSVSHWTGLLQDPRSGEILGVGRQRRIPPGLRRWLQARDATCRFPGCISNALTAEVDHTIPWARGGPTSHENLECLCRKHHAFKTSGFWKARQPEPGVLEWTSPAGRTYQTQAYLSSSRIQGDTAAASESPTADVPPPF